MTGLLLFNSRDGASSKGGDPFLILLSVYLYSVNPAGIYRIDV